MGERAIVNRVKKLKALEEQQKAITKEIELVKSEIKKEMTDKNTDTMMVGEYTIRWTDVISNKFDSTAFKKSFGEMYKQFTKQVSSRRFSIS